ncbi:CreA family protein [Aquabacterium sp. OR-4]|uniref:CreA family protein n=1 Tax=Aquabacterium sp. OR-4 TaxID=2978127 RepID=UPI0021B2ED49|nr:CreA family protein [Aquabacterium sp. OR-4]MDT7837289.1 CreA family protein [Aquabacterium sp. OR-4]
MPIRRPCLTLAATLLLACGPAAMAEQLGEVDTAFKLIGPDHKIVVEAYDDPAVPGITCFVSRAKTGGVRGALGLAEDKAEASIACRQVGPIQFPKPLPRQDELFSERISLVFKRLRVVRIVDARRNALVYLTYSDRLIDGSPQNAVTAVAVDRATPIPLK